MNRKKYILWFAQEHINFRYPELQSLLSLLKIPNDFSQQILEEVKSNVNKPFAVIELPNDDFAKQLVSRSISVRGVIEHWSSGTTYNSFHQQLKDFVASNIENPHFKDVLKSTFRVTVESYNKHIQQKDKVSKIETLAYLPFGGDVNLKSPECEYYYIEYYGIDPMNRAEDPERILFGKWLADGNRAQLKEISLKTRKFIGNTSMDPTLSMLMANQALAKPGDLVFDPFVGTGSLLVAAAKYGAYVMGTDIDYLMLHGKTKPTRVSQKVRAENESILLNMKQYNCSNLYMDVLVSDFSNSIWHKKIQFDSIITDPPYGVREAREKIETKSRRPLKPDATGVVHYPSTSPYQLSSLYEDLLRFAAEHLRIGGRLVCWIPIYKREYSDECIPKSSCFKLVANSEQYLSSIAARRLLTYEKIADPTTNVLENINSMQDDFRPKFFAFNDQERQEKRLQRAELKELGRQEALKRGKSIVNNEKQ